MDYKTIADKVLNMLRHADGNDPSEGHLTMDRWEWPTGVALYGIFLAIIMPMARIRLQGSA